LLRIIVGSVQHHGNLAAECRGFETHNYIFILSLSSMLGWDFSLIDIIQRSCPFHGYSFILFII
jgi:hypothetical protein